jgi:acyl carrier protein
VQTSTELSVENMAAIVKIVADILEIDPEILTPESQFVQDFGADSLTAIEICSDLERRFNIRIAQDQLSSIANLESIYNLVSAAISE